MRADFNSGGLSTAQANALLEEWGANEFTTTPGFRGISELLKLALNPLVVILLVASVISGILGQAVESALIGAMIFLGLAINFVQTYRSQHAVERLREGVTPTATALRDGKFIEVPRRQLVPGDVIRLSAGDMVPADAGLVEARDLHVLEAALTGESFPVEKNANPSPGLETADAKVYLGSSVVSGTARALVTETGPRTAYGSIVARLADRAPETEFDRGARHFGLLIMQTVFGLVIFVFLANAMLHRDLLESLLFAVALAVGLTPEFLPVISAVTLGRGAVRLAELGVVVKHLSAMQNFGSIDILCSDKTGTLTSGEMGWRSSVDPLGNPSEAVFRLGYINSFFETGIRSPLEQAILAAKTVDMSQYRKLDEVPFDFERRRLSVAVGEEGRAFLITKGSPEGILGVCSRFRGGRAEEPLTPEMRSRCEEIYKQLSETGVRVLAVATRALPPGENPVTKSDERDLVLEGFLGFFDPPLAHIAQVVRSFREDGVRVKVLTGDSDLVARHVCHEIGINAKNIILGQEIERMSDSALAHVAETCDVFARITPAHKNRIILALKSRKHVVGYMGDGINDAPSLRAADVGISFSSAVDVARETADIILLKRDLRVLHQGILEGRKAFGNVMKYLLMGTSSNFGNMFSMAIASLVLPFLPMLPAQILLNNFLYDLAQITIPTDRVDDAYVRKPRHWDISIIGKFMVFIGPLSSIYDFLTFYVLLKFFRASEHFFQTGWFVESLVTQTLVIFSIRTFGSPFKSRPSNLLAATVACVVLIGLLLPVSPFAKLLGFVPLPAVFFLYLAGLTVTYLFLVEKVKRRLMR